MKKKTTLTKMHIAPSTVRYDAVAARDSNEVGQILAGTRKRNGYSLLTIWKYTCKYQIISLYGRKLLWQDPREARIRLVL